MSAVLNPRLLLVPACNMRRPAVETMGVELAESPMNVILQVTGSEAEFVRGCSCADEIGYAAAAASSDANTEPGAGAGACACTILS